MSLYVSTYRHIELSGPQSLCFGPGTATVPPWSLCLGLGTATVAHGRCVLVWALPQWPTVAVSWSRHCHSGPWLLYLCLGSATVAHSRCASVAPLPQCPHGRCISVQALPQCPHGRCDSVWALPQWPIVAVSWSGHCHSGPWSLCLGLGTATVAHGCFVSV